MAHWQICNVYRPSGNPQLWQFNAANGEYRLGREYVLGKEEVPPKGLVGKTWGTLLRKRLNIAWLPPGTAFLRVVQLPVCELAELLSMVEFQLERVSPLPVAQVVWSVEVLPGTVGGQQTVIVVIAERQAVESFLGQLEGQGFMADRLEAPVLDQLLQGRPEEDSIWVYPPQVGTDSCWVVGWWYGGVLRHLGLAYLPDTENRQGRLKEQLQQMAWAGELEGWLTGEPRWHLVADSVSASLWEPVVREVAGEAIEVHTPPPPNRLAAQTALRAARKQTPGLLPVEFAERYRARFVDGLWMSGLGSIMMVYLAAVLVYFGFLKTLNFQLSRAEGRVTALSGSYTNAMEKKSQLEMLLEQQNFKYAALECWDAVARSLPQDLTLNSMSFSRERTLALFGTASQEGSQAILEFNQALKQAQMNGKPLFAKVNAPFMGSRTGNTISWNFTCELNRLESE